MSGTDVRVNSIKGTSTLVRAKFGPGMLLQHDDLEQLGTYTRELSRLMFRSLFGCGVVCGLVVTTEPQCGKIVVKIGAGLALDGNGDPVYVPKDQSVPIDNDCNQNIAGPVWVVLCGNSKSCAPRTSMCASDEDESPSVSTRERDGFEIRLLSARPDCSCGCPEPQAAPTQKNEMQPPRPGVEEDPCYKDHYAGVCSSCGDGSGCDCTCILLAKLTKVDNAAQPSWTVDHRVRRFVRPMLMPDPQVARERQTAANAVEAQKKADDDAKKAAADQVKADEAQKEEVGLIKTEADAKDAAAAVPEAAKPDTKSTKSAKTPR